MELQRDESSSTRDGTTAVRIHVTSRQIRPGRPELTKQEAVAESEQMPQTPSGGGGGGGGGSGGGIDPTSRSSPPGALQMVLLLLSENLLRFDS